MMLGFLIDTIGLTATSALRLWFELCGIGVWVAAGAIYAERLCARLAPRLPADWPEQALLPVRPEGRPSQVATSRSQVIDLRHAAPRRRDSSQGFAPGKPWVSAGKAMKIRIMEMIAASDDGLTADECELALNGQHQSVSARIYDLVNEGAIVESGRSRATRTGRLARIYVLADQRSESA